MITIQTVENIKKGGKITLANGIYAIILGICYIIFYDYIMNISFKNYDFLWHTFTEYNPEISNFFLYTFMSKGIFMISLGICIIYFSNFIIKKKDKTAWVVLFIIGLVFWASLLTFEIFTRNIYLIVASFIGWLMFILGMTIPLKYYTQKVEDY